MYPKKVLHIITHLGVGGAQDNTFLTLEKHDRKKFEVHLASFPEGQWAERAVSMADHFHPCPNLIHPISLFEDTKCLLSLIKLMRREKIDIVHTHSSKAGILGRIAAAIARVPIVVHTVHGFAFHDFMPVLKRQFYIFLERFASLFTDFFLTVSELNRQEAIQLGLMSKQNSQTVYSGIDFSRLDASVGSGAEMRKKLGFEPDMPIVLMVGRLDQQKAPYYLIEAFAQVNKAHPDAHLLLVGDGDLRPQLEQQTSQLQLDHRVSFLGSREDVPDILQASDIFALSSLWEGLGRAMTEAMLAAKPVVVPNIYGIPETVHHNETGLLFPAKDVDQLAQHINYLIEYPEERQRIGQNAKALTRRLFSADKMVEDIEAIYDKLLNARSSFSRQQPENTPSAVSQSSV